MRLVVSYSMKVACLYIDISSICDVQAPFERPSCCYVLRLSWKQKEFFRQIDLRILSLVLVKGAKRQCFLVIATVSTSCNMALAEGPTRCACTGGRWFSCESCKIGQRSNSSSRDGSTPMHGQTFCRKLKHFKHNHTLLSFCRTLTHLVNCHAFALCRPKISFNGCSVSALTLFLLTAHMVLTTTTCSCTLQSYRVRLGKDCLQLSVWSMLQVCPSTFNTHTLAFAAMLPCILSKLSGLQCCLLFAERPYATQDAIKVFFEKLYQYNPALNPAAFMLDKAKSEHYAAGSYFALTSAAVHWSCNTAHLYEEQISIGVIAVAQACCEPVLHSNTEQQGAILP